MEKTATKQRMTQQRQIILNELMSRKDHPTADELYGAVRKRMPRISLGTVYRNLDVLIRNGLAIKLDTVGAQARYDADVSPHCHVRCVTCGRVDDIHGPSARGVELAPADSRGYEVTGVRVEFQGVCPECRCRV
ncbi:MAG: transcriptional repressor [Candidatus Hydrogenedentes bacterium]|nr:transcriptional repressor [Candidatus Hydrogenedentota bacterium]